METSLPVLSKQSKCEITRKDRNNDGKTDSIFYDHGMADGDYEYVDTDCDGYYDKKIMTIPKLGYKKTNMRPDSLFYNYYNDESKKISPVEAKFWFNTAKKECYFKQDRGIKYEENEIS